MPCMSQPRTPEIVKAQATALQRLEAALAAGTVAVAVSSKGGVAFRGWKDTAGLADLCAYRALTASNSPALRRALARAEVIAGRKVDAQVVASGTHSHDGGKTWHPGH